MGWNNVLKDKERKLFYVNKAGSMCYVCSIKKEVVDVFNFEGNLPLVIKEEKVIFKVVIVNAKFIQVRNYVLGSKGVIRRTRYGYPIRRKGIRNFENLSNFYKLNIVFEFINKNGDTNIDNKEELDGLVKSFLNKYHKPSNNKLS